MKPKPKKLPTRNTLVARLDAAIERTTERRIALRMAERAMLDARHQLEKFDAQATHKAPQAHRR